jgi:hypothetical protein
MRRSKPWAGVRLVAPRQAACGETQVRIGSATPVDSSASTQKWVKAVELHLTSCEEQVKVSITQT